MRIYREPTREPVNRQSALIIKPVRDAFAPVCIIELDCPERPYEPQDYQKGALISQAQLRHYAAFLRLSFFGKQELQPRYRKSTEKVGRRIRKLLERRLPIQPGRLTVALDRQGFVRIREVQESSY